MSIRAWIKSSAEGLIELCRQDVFDAHRDALNYHDHGLLSGLSDDDHTQYYNQTRGDARYANLTGDTMTGTLEAPEFTVDGSPVVDSGSNANGNWVKYYDGTLIQYGNHSFAAGTFILNSGVYYSDTAVLSFPLAFFSNPKITVGLTQATVNPAVIAKPLAITTTTWSARMMAWATTTGASFTVDFIAVGAWK